MKGILVIVAALSFSAAVFADEPVRGFYVGGGVGNATLRLEDTDSPADFEDDDTGYRLIGGYRWFRYFAVEANITDYGTQEGRILGADIEGDFSAIHAAAVGLIPLGSFDLFGKAGIAFWDGSLERLGSRIVVSENNAEPVLGLGAQFRAGQLTIRGEAETLLLSFDDDGDGEADGDDYIGFVSLSATWSF